MCNIVVMMYVSLNHVVEYHMLLLKQVLDHFKYFRNEVQKYVLYI